MLGRIGELFHIKVGEYNMAIGNLSINDKTDINSINNTISQITADTYPKNFINLNLNSINIDDLHNFNFCVGISVHENAGTIPEDCGWVNVVQFYCNHFRTQIATEVFSDGGGVPRMYMRTHWGGDNNWSQWVQMDINNISSFIGYGKTPNVGGIDLVESLNILHTNSENQLPIHSLVSIPDGKTFKTSVITINSVYLLLAMPWGTGLGCQELYLVSTMSSISVVRLDNGTDTNITIESGAYHGYIKVTNTSGAVCFIKLMMIGNISASDNAQINANYWEEVTS